ncbi:malonyl-ACP O-methyltransferase BioC [Paenibacillus sp. LMG 31461]|uniref:Malonyl-[acyl-carrier protein] O-methyltransferase n=1 Tax=Paenibacillus plantarum TaxID=2654975 RepID=A0ABX1X7U6_9BACL|nr:malonyl-ACP O-methyltransferase BioC [Paenibacillus plantarum]NOU64507.1 malonyl-ACP O-methyltransferase BioC [Paenibacillus plantarum]
MNTRTTAIRRQFNRSSQGLYDQHAHVQRSMADRLAQSLGDVHAEKFNILEIGCGTGALTEILLNTWSSSVSITALDIAPEMIKEAEQRVRSRGRNELDSLNGLSSRIRFLVGDVETWVDDAASASFDLIVSNACFQWLHHPRQTLGHLRRIIRPGGRLVFTTFGPDTFNELHKSFQEVYRASGLEPQRHGLTFQSSEQWKDWLIEAGYSRIQVEREVRKESYTSVRDFLYSVKAMGASTTEAIAWQGLSTRRLFAKMYEEYEGKFGIPGGVVASYELLMIEALADEGEV